MPQRFQNSEQAEAAYYQALRNADLDAMMNVWQEDAHIVCLHPFSERVLRGYPAILEGWLHTFARQGPLQIQPSEVIRLISTDMAVHNGIEHVTHASEAVPLSVYSFTHVYRRTLDGWRMVLRHVSSLSERPPLAFGADLDESGSLH